MTAAGPRVRPPLWTRSFVLLTLANLGVFVTFYMLAATLAGYAVIAYGASPSEAGLVSSIFFIGGTIGRFVVGRALARLGSRVVVLGSTAWLLATCLLYLLPSTLTSMLVIRVLHGIGFGFAATALASTVMGAVPATRRGEGSGWFTAGMAVATGLAPAVGLWLLRTPLGQSGVFMVTAACAAVAVLTPLLVRRDLPGRIRRGTDDPPHESGLASLLEWRTMPIGLAVGFCAFPFSTILAFLNPYAVEHGLTDAAAFYFLAYAVVIVVSRPVAGLVQDRYGDDIVTVPVMLSLAAGTVLTAVAPNGTVLVLAGGLLGLGYGTLTSVGQAIAVGRAGAARVGVGVATYFLLVDLGTGLGPFTLGALVPSLGYTGTFLVGAAFVGLGLTAYLLVARRVRPAP
ncbi:MAG: hypothetical protein CSA84_05385 [Actinomycetales bacterium]|nr:MAG: hypothetical protein CSA84_05385 [Actinomycetales bacterium]